MTIDTILEQIEALRQTTEPNSITPEVDASILQNISEYIRENVYNRTDLAEALRKINVDILSCLNALTEAEPTLSKVDNIEKKVNLKADISAPDITDKANNKVISTKDGLVVYYSALGKEALYALNGTFVIKNNAGAEMLKINTDGSIPGITLRGHTGSYGLWIGELGASWMYPNGMYAMTSSKNDFRDIKQGLIRYFSVDSGSEPPFDRINGIDPAKPQYEMLTKSGKVVTAIDKDGYYSINHPSGAKALDFKPNELSISDFSGNKSITINASGSTPGLLLKGHKGAYGILIAENTTTCMYHNGSYAWTISKVDFLDVKKGFIRYYPIDNNPEIKFDWINGLEADKPYYIMYNPSGNPVLKIDRDEKLHLLPWSGKTLMFAGDSLMTGYPVADYNMTDTAKVQQFGYPYIFGRYQNADIKLAALPNAVIRTHKQNGQDLTSNKSRSLARKITEAEILYPAGSPERSEAIAFSYENSIMPYIKDIDLFCFGFGANDVEVDKNSNTTWEPNSEFVKFDVNDQFNAAKFSIDSRDRKSFIGSTNYIIDAMLAVKPSLKFCFIAHPTNFDAQTNSDQHRRLNVITKSLAAYWGVPYIDMYNKLGWSHTTNTQNSPLMYYCPDKIHFATENKKGLDCYVSALEKALIEI